MPSILFGPYAGAAGLALKLQAAVLLQAGAPGAYAPEMAPVVDPSSTAIVSRFDSGFIEAMPILGHDYQDILTLAPGVDDPDGDGAPNVRGARDTDLQTRFDGGDTTDPVSGLAGQNLSPLAVERIDAITAGAPARYGRAMGGFADVTTRSGGNDFTGRLALYWSGRFLDGDGSNRNDIDRFQGDLPAFHDARGAVSVGGPIVRDRAWYFASFERLDREESVSPYEGTGEISSRGTYYMGKLSWQSGETHRTSFQIIGDPRRIDGLGVSPTTDLDSGFSLDQGGLSAQLSWAASVSDSVRFEAAITHLHTEFDVEPSSRFHERIPVVLDLTGSLGDPHALIYPCEQSNCSETLGERRFYRIDGFTGRARGPYPFENDDERRRDALRADVTIDVEGAAGSHRLAGGFELGREELRRLSHLNPILIDSVTVFGGSQTFFVYRPAFEDRRVADQATGLYISDSWKPAPNLLITAGLRFDKEEIDAPGFVPFDPLAERRRSVALWRAVCEEAVIQGIVPVSSNCSPLRPYDGLPPTDIPSFQSFR
ncbi:MAG TPA: TonB-dependent receptor plug domain-containing protein, partial [Candidatus Polarisedimenticolia bacterium]|nr:TonB-dependent receptor plug domain-containing protein [Candidatus Polarisedimenticolia bacterium]